MDLDQLYRKLEYASFTQREQIADEIIRDYAPEMITTLVRGLEHPTREIRLGIIEILRRAGCREALRKLLDHAKAHDGDDRIFAVRALAQLAQPGDDFLRDPVKGWIAAGDPFVEPHAQKLAAVIVPPKPAVVEPTATEVTLEKLVVDLFTAVRGADRLAIVEAIEKRGVPALVAAAKIVFQKGNEHLVAYVCRAVIRQASAIKTPETLIPLLERTRKRLGVAPIAGAAIDDTLLALGGLALSPALLARLGEMDKPQVDAVAARLGEAPAEEVALHVPRLLDLIGLKPPLWSSLGPVFVYAAPHLRDSTRGELRRLTELVVDDLRKGKPLPPVTVVSATFVLARIAERGEPLPRHLRLALDRIAAAEAASALAALCAKLATEEAATVLLAMQRDPLPAGREAAAEAIAAWQSPWITIENAAIASPANAGHAAPPEAVRRSIVPAYVDDKGEPLARRGDRLVVPISGEEYVLDGRGRPVRNGETEFGGCLCCSPQRALIRRRGEGLRCPTTWESHLRDGTRLTLERDHALGRCQRCDSARPRVRDGSRVICLDCGAGIGTDAPVAPPTPPPSIPSEHGRAGSEDALPMPPTRDELEHIAPPIRSAIASNVFLHARDGDQRWNGSGIVIARDGNHIAILTNRHVVESDDRSRLCAVDAMLVSGEATRISCVWRAQRGVDLAIVEARVQDPERVGVMPLGSGTALVGHEVFTIGNPLGLAWSYSAGTLSAIRHWTTQDGQSVRILQTDATIAPGSSGGGLFHRDGHLLGVMSFLRQGYAGGSAHFALSIEAIRDAFAREDVRWHGQQLANLPR